MHDAATNLFNGVVYDLSGNGIAETFVSMDAAGITDIEVDADEDGRIDRRLQPNTDGTFRHVGVPPSVSGSD